jgi:precorrin-2 dehydrogenase/sirohydrochlorin ferrochelatase
MKYYPVHLNIENRYCLVVGGGSVGTRKVETLLECGARVTVVSPVASEQLHQLQQAHKIKLEERAYQSDDLEGKFLVIGATNDEKLNRQISQDAENNNMLCNIADRPEVCNFILPSVVQRGDLVITISTSGKSPALAKKLRETLETQFGAEYAQLLVLMGAIRKRLLSRAHAPEAHKKLFEQLIEGELLKLLKEDKSEEINELLNQILGEGYRIEELIQ